MHVIIIQLMCSIVVTFLIKASWRNAVRKKMGLLLLPVWKENCKTFCPTPRNSPSHRQAGAPVFIQSTLRIAPDFCTNVSLPVLFGNNCESYAVLALVCVYNIEKLVGRKKFKNIGIAVNAACKGNLSMCLYDHAAAGSSSLVRRCIAGLAKFSPL